MRPLKIQRAISSKNLPIKIAKAISTPVMTGKSISNVIVVGLKVRLFFFDYDGIYYSMLGKTSEKNGCRKAFKQAVDFWFLPLR